MTPRELMRAHVAALFTHDARGRMLRVNEPGGAEAPRFFLGRTAEGAELRFRHDLDDGVARALRDAASREPAGDEFLDHPHGIAPYEEILAPVHRTWTGPAFRFPRELPEPPHVVSVTAQNVEVLRAHLGEWMGDVESAAPMLALLVRGRAVSLCCSVRRGPVAHEAGVETAEGFRGRGYAAAVVAEWARSVRAGDRVPLYSTSWLNATSQAVGRRLGLVRYGTTLHIT